MSDSMTDEWYEKKYCADHRKLSTISWEAVIADMKQRNTFGYSKYNKYLEPHCGEDMLQHLYEELLDAAVYIKTLIMERQHGIDN